jgi:hypothetical protein
MSPIRSVKVVYTVAFLLGALIALVITRPMRAADLVPVLPVSVAPWCDSLV